MSSRYDQHRSRYSRSRSRSRDRNTRRRNSRSHSRDRYSSSHHRRHSDDKDLYHDIINDDYRDDRMFNNYGCRSKRGGREDDEKRERVHWRHTRDYDRDYEKNEQKDHYGHNPKRYGTPERGESDYSDEVIAHEKKTPSRTVIVLGLQPHITEADIMSSLIRLQITPSSIRLIRKPSTGASRGFAFVEFLTVEEATNWMEITKGQIQLADDLRATLEYSHTSEIYKAKVCATDWYCVKCGVYNFKRRLSCFKCSASREDSEQGCEGNDEVSNILTKKIMMRNLDALTNEEGVLTALQKIIPELAGKIVKILVSRDQLTQTSRGICYLSFDNLVDSMNVHNALTERPTPLTIDNREINISYCIDHDNRQIIPKEGTSSMNNSLTVGAAAMHGSAAGQQLAAASYTLADVPRLAEYSASLYATNPTEHAHYVQYYTEYYINEINSGNIGNLPTAAQVTEANSGAAVALSAIQRKQRKMSSIETTATAAAAAAAQAAAAVRAAITAAQPIVTPKGNDGKIYPTPDVSLYQYDETSGYYYDPTTGLYYDAHSQYYYNNETGAYLYWDQRRSTYTLATPASAQAAVMDVVSQETSSETKTAEEESKKEKSKEKPDKVKIAKKIVKDMEKWAKQLNQKKDYVNVATPQPILTKSDEESSGPTRSITNTGPYADVCFSILEKKERKKMDQFRSPLNNVTKLVSAYGSESEEEQLTAVSSASAAKRSTTTAAINESPNEKEYVDFQKLTCLLCKRAFQSLEILQKHLKISNLHKENLAKHNLSKHSDSAVVGGASGSNHTSDTDNPFSANYRDRAKERRQKYGESDAPPPNRSRERFEHEIKSLQSRSSRTDSQPELPITSSNVGSRLLQKMGWSEGQGLGRKNQGRTEIVEAEGRFNSSGLGTKSGIGPGDDYKTYIKKMMKSRYESA